MGNYCSMGTRVSVWEDENVWRWVLVMAAEQRPRMVHLELGKTVYFTSCILNFNKKKKKNLGDSCVTFSKLLHLSVPHVPYYDLGIMTVLTLKSGGEG